MYQNGGTHPSLASLAGPGSGLNMGPSTSSNSSPYSHENLSASFMHTPSTPVYVPTNRPSIHGAHMSAYGMGNGTGQPTPPSLSGTPTGSAMWQTDNLGMPYTPPSATSRFGFPSAQPSQMMTPSDAAAAAAAAYAGTTLQRAPASLNPYSPYMRADFNAWSNFSNMALQGFKQTIDQGKCFPDQLLYPYRFHNYIHHCYLEEVSVQSIVCLFTACRVYPLSCLAYPLLDMSTTNMSTT